MPNASFGRVTRALRFGMAAVVVTIQGCWREIKVDPPVPVPTPGSNLPAATAGFAPFTTTVPTSAIDAVVNRGLNPISSVSWNTDGFGLNVDRKLSVIGRGGGVDNGTLWFVARRIDGTLVFWKGPPDAAGGVVWTPTPIPSAAGKASLGRPAAVLWSPNGPPALHVVYRAANGTMRAVIAYPPGQWTDIVLDPTAPVAAGDPVLYVWQGRLHVVYRDQGNRIQAIYWDGAAWRHSLVSPAGVSAAASDPVANPAPPIPMLLYRGVDQAAHSLVLNGNSWTHTIVSASGQVVVDEPRNMGGIFGAGLTVFRTQSGDILTSTQDWRAGRPAPPAATQPTIYNQPNRGWTIAYADAYGHIYRLWNEGNKLIVESPSGPPAATELLSFQIAMPDEVAPLGSKRGLSVEHFVYLGFDGLLHGIHTRAWEYDSDPSNRFRFVAVLDPLKTAALGKGQVEITSQLKYWLEGSYKTGVGWADVECGGFGSDWRLASVRLVLNLSVDSNWGLGGNATADQPRLLNPCVLGTQIPFSNDGFGNFLAKNVPDKIVGAIHDALQRSGTTLFGPLGPGSDLQAFAGKAWQLMQSSIVVDSTIRLDLNPEAVSIGPIEQATRDSVRIALSIVARPQLGPLGGNAPPAHALPPPRNGPQSDAFAVPFQVVLPFADANARIAKEFPRVIDTFGHRITVARVRIDGASGREVVVSVMVKENCAWIHFGVGCVTGTIFLHGTPVWNGSDGSISVPDLDFSVETRNKVNGPALWMLGDPIRAFLRRTAHWDFAKKVDSTRQKISDALNGPIPKLGTRSGVLNTFAIDGITVGPTELRVHATATGVLKLTIAP